MPPAENPSEQDVAHADEQAAGERISYILKKYGCSMVPVIELRAGQVAAKIDIVKIPPDMLRKLRKAERDGQPLPGSEQSPAPGA
jgi:hypothetical protein